MMIVMKLDHAVRPCPVRGRWIAALLWAVACSKGVDEPLSTTIVLGDASADGDDTDGDTQGTAGATSLGGSGQVDGTGDGLDTSGAADGPADDTTTAGPPPICPVEPDDVPCEVCGKEQCCGQYLACLADTACACALECYLGGGETADCFVTCGASNPALDLFNCAAPACEGICV